MNQNLTSKAVKGVQWTTASTIITSILQIGYTSIMSRLLDPTAFGIIAIAQIVLHFGSYFSRMGMAQALIQKIDLNKNDIRAVFTSSILLSSAVAALIWIAAPYCNLVFDKVSDEVVPIIRTLSVNFLIAGLSTTAIGLLTRKLKFKQLAIQEIVSFAVAYIGVGVSMGLLGFGVWSLVFAHISQTLLLTIFSYVAARHTLMPILKWEYYKPFFKYGSVFSITTIIDFLGMNLPMILIGKIFGDYKLGIYRQAFMIINLPMAKLSMSIQKVVFPMYSKIQGDEIKLKKSYLSSATLMAAVFIPLGFGISVSAKEITLVLLGNDFIESYPVLAVLALGISFKFLSQFAGIIWDAKAYLKVKLYIQSFYLLALIAASYVFKGYGLIGFAWIVTIGEVLRNFVFMIVTARILNVSAKEHLMAYFPGLFIGLVSAAAVYGISYLMDQISAHLLLKLFAQMITGGVTLVYLIFVNPVPALREQIKEYFLKISFFSSGKGKFLLNYLSWYNSN